MSKISVHAQTVVAFCTDFDKCKKFLSQLDRPQLKEINDLLLTAHSRVNAEWRQRAEKVVKEPVIKRKRKIEAFDDEEVTPVLGENDLIF